MTEIDFVLLWYAIGLAGTIWSIWPIEQTLKELFDDMPNANFFPPQVVVALLAVAIFIAAIPGPLVFVSRLRRRRCPCCRGRGDER